MPWAGRAGRTSEPAGDSETPNARGARHVRCEPEKEDGMQGSALCCSCVKSTPFCCEQGLRQDQTQAAAGPVRPATGGGGRGVCVTHVQGQRSDHSPIASAPQSRALQDTGGRGPLRVPRRPHYADTNQTRTARSRRTADRHPSRTRAQSTRHRQAEFLIHTKNNTSQPGGFIWGVDYSALTSTPTSLTVRQV